MSIFHKAQNTIFDKHGVHVEHKTMYQIIMIIILAAALIIFILMKPAKVEYRYDVSNDPVANSLR